MTENEKTNQNQDIYSEINLWKLVHTIFQNKRIICGITLTFMIISSIGNFFIKPEYQATATVAPASISSLTNPSGYPMIITDAEGKSLFDSSKMSNNLDQIVKLAQVDVDGYKELLLSNDILYKTINKVGLQMPIDGVKKSIEITKTNNIIQIKFTNKDPNIAAVFINALIEEASAKFDELNTQKMNDLSKSLDEQLKAAQSDLAKAANDLKTYNANNSAANMAGYDIDQKLLNDELTRTQYLVHSLGSKILELRITKSLSAAEDRIVVLSPAVTPEKPTGPSQVLAPIIAGVLGFMLSIFGMFFIEYYRRSQKAFTD